MKEKKFLPNKIDAMKILEETVGHTTRELALKQDNESNRMVLLTADEWRLIQQLRRGNK